MENTRTPAFLLRYWDAAKPLSAFLEDLMATPAQLDSDGLGKYIAINQQRVKRIRKTMQLSDDVRSRVEQAPAGLRWLVINEHWCGDGAQILPVVEAVEQLSGGKIAVRALLRDENLDLMDAFLTDGARSIPKIVGLNPDGMVYGTFGPRPQEAVELVRRVKSDPETAPTYSEVLHKWYADDKQASIQKELVEALVDNAPR